MSKTLRGLTFKDNTERLHCRRLSTELDCPNSRGNISSVFTVSVISAGTFTILPLILNCFP